MLEDEPDARNRELMVAALGAIAPAGDEETIGTLLRRGRDEDAAWPTLECALRSAAAVAARAGGRGAGAAALREAALQLVGSPNAYVRAAAVRALAAAAKPGDALVMRFLAERSPPAPPRRHADTPRRLAASPPAPPRPAAL
jgi:hypothetical protein